MPPTISKLSIVQFPQPAGGGAEAKSETDEEKEIHCLDISRHEHEHQRSTWDIRSMTMTFRFDETSDNCGFCGGGHGLTYMVDAFRYWECRSNF